MKICGNDLRKSENRIVEQYYHIHEITEDLWKEELFLKGWQSELSQ
jgi:hypothetical protein